MESKVAVVGDLGRQKAAASGEEVEEKEDRGERRLGLRVIGRILWYLVMETQKGLRREKQVDTAAAMDPYPKDFFWILLRQIGRAHV